MLLIITEWQDSKVHVFEVELLVNTGRAHLDLISSKECNTVEETLEFINELDLNNLIRYVNLTLDYNNKKYSNVRDKEDLIALVNQDIPKLK